AQPWQRIGEHRVPSLRFVQGQASFQEPDGEVVCRLKKDRCSGGLKCGTSSAGLLGKEGYPRGVGHDAGRPDRSENRTLTHDHTTSSACMTVTAWPPRMMRSPFRRTRTTPPRGDA